MTQGNKGFSGGLTAIWALAMGLAVLYGGAAQAAVVVTELAPPAVEKGLFVRVDTRVEEMPPGMANAYVRGIQEELAAHGYRPGPVDGVAGARSLDHQSVGGTCLGEAIREVGHDPAGGGGTR